MIAEPCLYRRVSAEAFVRYDPAADTFAVVPADRVPALTPVTPRRVRMSEGDPAARKAGRFRRLVLSAMLEFQHKGHRVGSPESAQPYLDALAKLLDDPDAEKRLRLRLSWSAAPTKAGGVKAVGAAEHAGRTLYGARAQAALRAQEARGGMSAGEVAERAAKSSDRAREIIGKAVNYQASKEEIQELAQHLPHLPAERLRSARLLLGASFGGQRRVAQMRTALMDHVRGLVDAMDKEETKESATAAEDVTPEAKPAEPTPASTPTAEPEPAEFEEEFARAAAKAGPRGIERAKRSPRDADFFANTLGLDLVRAKFGFPPTEKAARTPIEGGRHAAMAAELNNPTGVVSVADVRKMYPGISDAALARGIERLAADGKVRMHRDGIDETILAKGGVRASNGHAVGYLSRTGSTDESDIRAAFEEPAAAATPTPPAPAPTKSAALPKPPVPVKPSAPDRGELAAEIAATRGVKATAPAPTAPDVPPAKPPAAPGEHPAKAGGASRARAALGNPHQWIGTLTREQREELATIGAAAARGGAVRRPAWMHRDEVGLFNDTMDMAARGAKGDVFRLREGDSAKSAAVVPSPPAPKADVPAGHAVAHDLGGGAHVTRDPKTGDLTTRFPAGEPEKQAARLGTAIGSAMDEAKLYREYQDGVVPAGKIADLVRRKVPDATDAHVMAALSHLKATRAIQGQPLNEVQKLTAGGKGSAVEPLGGGKTAEASTLWDGGKAVHYWMMPAGKSGRDLAAPPAATKVGTGVDTPQQKLDTAPVAQPPAPGGGGGGGGKMDAKKLAPKEAAELEQLVAGAGSLPESVIGHPDPVGFTADVLDRVESGTATADDLRTVHGWMTKDAARFSQNPNHPRHRDAARLAALIAKMGG